MHQDIEIIRQFVAAINRNGTDSVAAFLAADRTRFEPDGFATAGRTDPHDRMEDAFVWALGQRSDT